MANHIKFLLGLSSALILSTALAATPDGSKEISTALDHAKLAAAGTDIKVVQLHLHHVVNCLAGAKGKGFDASAGDPCKDMGDGALNDTTKDKITHAKLEATLREADEGLKDKNYGSAKKIAEKIVSQLTAVEKTG